MIINREAVKTNFRSQQVLKRDILIYVKLFFELYDLHTTQQ